MLQTVQKTGRYLSDFANAELVEQVLTERELKARQSSKIREIGEALITAGFVSLNAQAKVFALPRSTAWTILSAKHKGTGLSARIIYRMLSSGELNANGKRPNGSPGGEILNEWHTQHGRRWPAWQCAGCGKMIGGLEGDDFGGLVAKPRIGYGLVVDLWCGS